MQATKHFFHLINIIGYVRYILQYIVYYNARTLYVIIYEQLYFNFNGLNCTINEISIDYKRYKLYNLLTS